MQNPAPLTPLIMVGLTLCVCVVLALAFAGTLERPQLSTRLSTGRVALGLVWLGLAWLLWISDYPAAWRLPEIIVYLAGMTRSAFRILLVTATGTVLFGSLVGLLFLTRPKRR